MSGAIEVLSTIATVISILDTVTGAMRKFYGARERQQNLSKVLQLHEQELDNIRKILKVVEEEQLLQVGTIVEDLQQLVLHGQCLQTTLQQYGKDRGQIKQYANQFFNGKKMIEDLAGIMASMSRTKANLTLNIQVVQVGVTRSVGDTVVDSVVVNCQLVESLDRKLELLFGKGQGLKLAVKLRDKQRSKDGTIYLKNSDIDSLSVSEMSSMSGEGGLPAGSTSILVDLNEAGDQALQVNGAIGEKGFVRVDHQTITRNKALQKSIQINHAISEDMFEKMLARSSRS